MREIEFRAWLLNQNRMERCVTVSPFYVSDCDRMHWKHEEVVLEQYTGLKDKHGKEIFEGDIIGVWFEKETHCGKGTWCEYPEVYFNEKYHAWCAKFEDGESEYLYEYDEDCEVVGNIHETKLEVMG